MYNKCEHSQFASSVDEAAMGKASLIQVAQDFVKPTVSVSKE